MQIWRLHIFGMTFFVKCGGFRDEPGVASPGLPETFTPILKMKCHRREFRNSVQIFGVPHEAKQ